ncbi:hypothetical protein LQ938_04175 [Microbacterium sp. cx-55]|uniref:hypothetical protein n=1 Tax=Microbacterium sp. cx-55 TaxID=2875948 RepID=UPI001CBB29BD|nr:hypothetical protein [Microbacterium sp. cx-55]MBZ4487088.1 hypothetical protein [Microbacterium sp. cx-55]UGB36001.1 hypothetical protein LQ938_04175 [Microbacterium sp. cx-55]
MRAHARTLLVALLSAAVLVSGMTASPAIAVAPAVDAALPASVAPAAVSDGVDASRIVPAADLAGFRPGNIISNEVFFNSSTMTEAQISDFLRQRVTSCQSGYTCLRDYQQDTVTRAGDAYCSTYDGAANESAARIIYKVAQACGLNPQVLLVTLQKEQSLVTNRAPSKDNFTIAMGQGCPDTAACDTRYYGFYNQVLGAARQFQIYSANKFFTYYAPGRTWNVRYNPNANCGSSPVYIENQATANLYYYTPYQPNGAALGAGYGLGDGCSAYGNRNFYNYFTDWFGSTQISTTVLVKLATDATVWLVSNGARWHVGNVEDYIELSRVFGAASVVGAPYISSLAFSGAAGAVLRDSTTGAIALIQDGQRHAIPSCELVAGLGGSCAAPVNVAAGLLARVPTGADVGSFFRVRGGERWGRFEDGQTVTPLYNAAAARSANNDVRTTPYAPYLNTDLYLAAPKRSLVFAPAQLVKAANDQTVYLTVDYDKLLYVPTWDSVADYNRDGSSLAVVSPEELSGYKMSGTVTPLLSCNGATYLPVAGWLNALANPSSTGLGVTSAGAATCAQFSARDGQIAGVLAIKTADSADVWVVDRGSRRYAISWSALVAQNGGAAPQIITVGRGTRDGIPEGVPVLAGSVVKTASSPDLLLTGAANTYWIPSGGLAADLGIALSYRVIPDAQATGLPRGSQLSSWIRCGTMTYFGAEGRMWPVSEQAARGFTPTVLDAAACATVSRGTDTLGLVAVKRAGSADVFVASGGQLRYVTSWNALLQLNGGAAPRVLTVSPDALNAMPAGAAVG